MKRMTKNIRRFHGGKYSSMSPEERYGMELTRAERKKLDFIRRQLINKHGAICAICGKSITEMKDCTIDHIKPLSKGGTTTLENCQLAHAKCNSIKGDYYEGGEE